MSADDSGDLRDAQPSTFPFTGKLGALRSELLKHELPVAKTILDPLWSRDAERFEKEYMRQHPWELTPEALINDLTETRPRHRSPGRSAAPSSSSRGIRSRR